MNKPVGEINKTEYRLSLPLRSTAVYTDDEGSGYGGVFDANDREVATCTMLCDAEALASSINSIDDLRLIAREAEDRLIAANLRNTAHVCDLQAERDELRMQYIAAVGQTQDALDENARLVQALKYLRLQFIFMRKEGSMRQQPCDRSYEMQLIASAAIGKVRK